MPTYVSSTGTAFASGTTPSSLYISSTGAYAFATPSGSNQVLTWTGSAYSFVTSSFPPALNVISTATGTIVGGADNQITFAGSCTATMPTTVSLGQLTTIYGGTGTFIVAQNASQTITVLGQTTTAGTGGSLTSVTNNQFVSMLCTTANTSFQVGAMTSSLLVT